MNLEEEDDDDDEEEEGRDSATWAQGFISLH